MLKFAIVDDEKAVEELLKTYLDRYTEERNSSYKAEWFSDPTKFLAEYTNRFDVVLLDIEMPEMNGMDVAKKMREMDSSVALVFVTNMKQYAINGYEVDADDFIVKPVSYFDFAMKLDRVSKKISDKKEVKVPVKTDTVVKYIDVSSVRYVDVYKHKLTYHTIDGDYENRGSLNKVEDVFLQNGFVKCNNYCMVNLRFIAGVDGYKLLVSYGRNSVNFNEVVISRPRKKEVVTALSKYMGVNV